MFKELLEDFEKLSLELTSDQVEVYASNVLDDLEKIALAKWKRNIRALSPKNKELLTKNINSKKMGWKEIESHMKKINEASKINPASRADRRRMHEANVSKKVLNYDSTVIDHEKELAGLNTGSYAMAKKFGVPMGHFDEQYIARKHKEYMRTAKVDMGAEFKGMTPKEIDQTINNESMIVGLTTVGEYDSMYHPTDKRARFINLGNDTIDNTIDGIILMDEPIDLLMGKPKSLDQRYAEAISARHEPDEIRSGVRKAKNVAKNYIVSPGTGEAKHRYLFHDHTHPDVIARESAHIAIAPSRVARAFTGLRADEPIPGIEYGKSAVPELKKSRKYAKQLLQKAIRDNPNAIPWTK